MNTETIQPEVIASEQTIPSKKEKVHRHWCKTCNEWESFEVKEEELTCQKCSSLFEEVDLTTIPEEKIEEQRNRFRNMRRTDFQQMMSIYQFMATNPDSDVPMLESTTSVVEDDAGLLALEKLERERKEAEYQAKLVDIAAHKHLGRNDKCTCNSGKKYKQCCLIRIKSYNI